MAAEEGYDSHRMTGRRPGASEVHIALASARQQRTITHGPGHKRGSRSWGQRSVRKGGCQQTRQWRAVGASIHTAIHADLYTIQSARLDVQNVLEPLGAARTDSTRTAEWAECTSQREGVEWGRWRCGGAVHNMATHRVRQTIQPIRKSEEVMERCHRQNLWDVIEDKKY